MRPSDVHITKGLVSKVIMGITFSRDAVTYVKLHLMSMIMDNADINWLGLLKMRLIEEAKKFVVDKGTNKYVSSTISMINKLSILLSTLMSEKA